VTSCVPSFTDSGQMALIIRRSWHVHTFTCKGRSIWQMTSNVICSPSVYVFLCEILCFLCSAGLIHGSVVETLTFSHQTSGTVTSALFSSLFPARIEITHGPIRNSMLLQQYRLFLSAWLIFAHYSQCNNMQTVWQLNTHSHLMHNSDEYACLT